MENMVSDLLDLSRIESSPGQFMPRPLDLPLFLADLKQRFADRLQSKRLLWSVELPSELREIMVNQDLLQLVLDNLVDNAIKFTEPGGQVTITGNRTGGADEVHHAVTLTVADTGCGIAEQEQQRVFERFYQVEKARSGTHRGTGLGLSIVRHAVTAMQGHVALESKPGQWTRVTVRIPQEGHS
jgi:signal transduction histidine kinase